MGVPYPDHRRPLYLEAQINDVFVRRALVDTGSSLNIIPLYVLKAAGIPQSRIVKSEMKYRVLRKQMKGESVSKPSGYLGTSYRSTKVRLTTSRLNIIMNSHLMEDLPPLMCLVCLCPSWRDIRDLSDEDFPMMTKRAKTQNKESSACVQVPPRCSRVVMPDGRTVYRL
ncbi:hypothetical protein M0R45_002150 [Rubus argutus]|uniref:Aspartic peptidase DDI1-type domain-containing protein n=1 Tax=Rubus argutus TaxID=59490 RepID=A0AAW1VD49_RUBAR